MMCVAKSRCLLLLMLFMMNITACHRAPVAVNGLVAKESVVLTKRDVKLVFMPGAKRIPDSLTYHKVDTYVFNQDHTGTPFVMELMINPLMRDAVMAANVFSNGRKVREFVAKKTASSLLSDNNTTWSPSRSKLVLAIPFVKQHEEVVITTSYEWMDIRYIDPIMVQEAGLIKESQVTIDVPYGVTMNFKAAKDAVKFELLPESSTHETKLWAQEDNRSGQGMRHIWRATAENQSTSTKKGFQLQLFVSFETPLPRSGIKKFDNWQAVSSYLYDRIDRYDVPSDALREYARKEIEQITDESQKVQAILAYLQKVKKRFVKGSYQDQEVQPATRTFARNFGSPFDIAILGKAMLACVGFASDLIIAADNRYNPNISDFYTPALFHSVLLAVSVGGKTIYFDPESSSIHNLSPHVQGQHALLLRPKNSILFTLPYDSADTNKETYSYQLWMTEFGALEGEYSVDLTGSLAQTFYDIPQEQFKLSPPSDIQEMIFGKVQTPFSWGTMEIERDAKEQTVRIVGEIKSKLLPKNEGGEFELNLAKVVEPLVASFRAPSMRGFSYTSLVSLFLSLPDHVEATNLPHNINIGFNGVDGRFSASYADNKVTIEGTSIVNLPIKKDVEQSLALELEQIKPWQEHAIIIHDKKSLEGVFEDGQQPSNQENL